MKHAVLFGQGNWCSAVARTPAQKIKKSLQNETYVSEQFLNHRQRGFAMFQCKQMRPVAKLVA
jgi:hypothetical protein